MPHPKRRTSRARSNKRRTHRGIAEPAMTRCPRCSAVATPHAVCENCGHYRGRKVLLKDEF